MGGRASGFIVRNNLIHSAMMDSSDDASEYSFFAKISTSSCVFSFNGSFPTFSSNKGLSLNTYHALLLPMPGNWLVVSHPVTMWNAGTYK